MYCVVVCGYITDEECIYTTSPQTKHKVIFKQSKASLKQVFPYPICSKGTRDGFKPRLGFEL